MGYLLQDSPRNMPIPCPNLLYITPSSCPASGDTQGKFSSFPTRLIYKVKMKSVSHVWLFGTLWTVAYQPPPSMGFSRQEYWSGLPFPSLGDLPNPGIEPRSPALEADALTSEPPGKIEWIKLSLKMLGQRNMEVCNFRAIWITNST